MKKIAKIIIDILFIVFISCPLAYSGTWSDGFDGNSLNPKWTGDKDNFFVADGYLQGRNAHPILLLPLKWVEIGKDWDDYIVNCKINVVMPNLLVCTKGGLVLRRNGNEGYVFALHTATKTVEVYRLSDGEILLIKNKDLQLEKWYTVKAQLQKDIMTFFIDGELIGTVNDKRSMTGSVGLAVQDALNVSFDDFIITGPRIDNGFANINPINKKISTLWAKIKYGGIDGN
ncbi:MAG: hypothetical protein ACPL7B_13950 [Candidatus Poribacteria bacterium]